MENQLMIGGDLAVKEPARMLISILSKFLSKDEAYKYIKKFYPHNQFELLYNQLKQNFNCQETSSTGRVIDAISILLGFAKNERNYKHEPAILLERNSTKPYTDLKPVIGKSYELKDISYELLTTPLFEYLLKNISEDKKRLAATAQLYIAQGLYEITRKLQTKRSELYLSGGIANNKIISEYLISKGAIVNQKIPRGDAGISLGQIFYHLANPWN
ncbi:hypothetical protein EPO05_03985 [Patescibacteria group bacterium]|nr:MAG: hypothetical protein EPO05_03985 [Patescibacteria group bacterium]